MTGLAAFTRLTLDLAVGSVPIAGELAVDGQAPTRFAGYVQLIQALEVAHGGDASRNHEPVDLNQAKAG